MSGDDKRGWFDRSQLLKIDANTVLDVVSESSDDSEADEDRIDPPVPDPVYARPQVARNIFRYSVGDTLNFIHPGWTHDPVLPGPARTREGIITRAEVSGVGDLIYSIRFTLANGRTTTRRYGAKPFPVNHPQHDPNEAIDTSANVVYLHS